LVTDLLKTSLEQSGVENKKVVRRFETDNAGNDEATPYDFTPQDGITGTIPPKPHLGSFTNLYLPTTMV
jgi:hypothetical protein